MSPGFDARRRVWVLTTERRGDNAQVLALADALGWPHEVKRLKQSSNRFMPPWPDLVLTIGRRSSEIAARIQRESGGRTRIVQVGPGDTRLGLVGFDLLIANPQSRLPARPNVMQLDLPMLYPDPPAMQVAAAEWLPRLERLPRPWTAILVGASTPPFHLDAAVARRMLSEIDRFTQRDGGSLLVSTSPRTPADVTAALRADLPLNAFLHSWSPNAGTNPYPAILALADRFVVTADSVSMQTEVIRLGKPLTIYRLPSDGKTWWRRGRHFLRSLRYPRRVRPARIQTAGLVERLTDHFTRLGIRQHRRDLRRFHRALIAAGRAVPFGEPFPADQSPPPDQLAEAVKRIERLFKELPA